MRREAQGVLLLAVGAAVVRVAVSGTAARFVRPGFVPALIVAGIAVGLLGAATLVAAADRWRKAGAATSVPDDLPEAGTVTTRERGRPAGWLLLVLPIALVVVAPPALGAGQGARYGSQLSAWVPLARIPVLSPLPAGDPVPLTVLEYATRAVADGGRSLSGRRVALSGFVLTGADGRPRLARLVVGCCAADARPVTIGLVGAVPANLVQGGWIEVVGDYTNRVDRDPSSGDPVPYLQVSAVRVVAPPAQPYLFAG